MMSRSFYKCPNCGARGTMEKASQQKTKFSMSKAFIGTFLAGPLGMLVGGAMGNKKITYRCEECGFEIEPDTMV